MMPADLERLGRRHVTQDEAEALWEALRQVNDRIEDIADGLTLLAGCVEWALVALPGQKVARDKTSQLETLDEARALFVVVEEE